MFEILKTRKALFVALIAIVAGFVSAKLLAQGNPLVTLPWGIVALAIGYATKNKREALVLGGCLGFVASYAYLWFDDTSKLTPASVALLIFVIILPALFGLLCGLLMSWLGWKIRNLIGRDS